MILRKPYAFFIKMFRPIHFVFVFLLGFLISSQSKIIVYLNRYLYTNEFFDTSNAKSSLISSPLYVIPILMILFSLIVFGIMYRKKKPSKFYFVTIFIFLAILVINIYTANFFEAFSKSIISIKTVKLIHDFVLMTILIESALIFVYLFRGVGLNFKKFDFSSDIAKFDVDEKDKEEFELDIKFDFNEVKRKRKERLRNFKYFCEEHKLLVIFITIVLFIGLSFSIIFTIIKNNKFNKEGVEYSLNGFNIAVEDTTITNENYEGNRVTKNYLVVVKAKLNSYSTFKSLYLKDFTLNIGDSVISPTKKYDSYLKDIGASYNNSTLSNDFREYIFVYEIPKKYITSEMNFRYTDKGYTFDIKLNPKTLTYEKKIVQSKIGDSMNFNDSLGDIKFLIKSYEIKDYYKMNYTYCTNDKTCLNSVEYLRPSINENYDKVILKLEVDYSNDSKLNTNTFYKFLNDFGDLYYLKNGEWKYQSDGFEKIISKKSINEFTFIGINEEVKNAESIKLVFNVRGLRYEYVLK